MVRQNIPIISSIRSPVPTTFSISVSSCLYVPWYYSPLKFGCFTDVCWSLDYFKPDHECETILETNLIAEALVKSCLRPNTLLTVMYLLLHYFVVITLPCRQRWMILLCPWRGDTRVHLQLLIGFPWKTLQGADGETEDEMPVKEK